jgi:hypothetical protein
MSSLTSAFDEWDWLLANPRFVRTGSTVAWEGYRPRILPFVVTPDLLGELAENGEYSFQVADGSIFRISYQFDAAGNVLRYGSLGFYKTIDDVSQAVASSPVVPGTEVLDELSLDVATASPAPPLPPSLPASIPWIRLDFDPAAARGVVHAATHLHLSLAESVRAPVAGVPTPKQFVETVISWFYPDDYERAHLDQHGAFINPMRQTKVNELFCPIAAEPTVLEAIHFLIPPAAARAGE